MIQGLKLADSGTLMILFFYFSDIDIFKLLALTKNILHKAGHEGELWSRLSSSYIKMWDSPQLFLPFYSHLNMYMYITQNPWKSNGFK